MKIKYAIHPGVVVSKNDVDLHFISYSQLVWHYKLNPKECMEWKEHNLIGIRFEDYVHLYPDSTGEYKLPVDE